jgi:hypothetical protein
VAARLAERVNTISVEIAPRIFRFVRDARRSLHEAGT